MAIGLSILSILIGYIVMAALVMGGHFLTSRLMLTGPHPTPAYINANLGIGAVAAFLGGVVCALIAPSFPMVHALILAGAVGSISATMMFSGPQPGQPNWYPLAVMGEGVLGVVMGGAVIAFL
ncbi:MAG: hypothetical protein H2040_11860 [Euryhalocaulis sp.]|uniref:hypothetical protein n=1 Tax=Euryhalocaulis sp. TaxID=2744307 RepID=UPI0017ACAB95|nr:hypothetical protein [Euryhalocaulis sp.]MBA4802545.1 hypothetical protein [Euryhalocaulis sp.]